LEWSVRRVVTVRMTFLVTGLLVFVLAAYVLRHGLGTPVKQVRSLVSTTADMAAIVITRDASSRDVPECKFCYPAGTG